MEITKFKFIFSAWSILLYKDIIWYERAIADPIQKVPVVSFINITEKFIFISKLLFNQKYRSCKECLSYII